jgi:hypothetical protein
VQGFLDWFSTAGERLSAWAWQRVEYLTDSETMIGAFIVTVWTVLGSMWAGWIGMLILLIVMLTLHGVAVESGSHVLLWIVTSALLVMIVLASQTVFGGLPPVFLALAGATALAHNDLVRLNYTRRRSAVVDDEVFRSAILGLCGVALIGIVAVGLAQVAAGGGERSWLWMPAAVGLLMALGFGLAIGPAGRGSPRKSDRWQPGQRIPPQPLGREDLDQF